MQRVKTRVIVNRSKYNSIFQKIFLINSTYFWWPDFYCFYFIRKILCKECVSSDIYYPPMFTFLVLYSIYGLCRSILKLLVQFIRVLLLKLEKSISTQLVTLQFLYVHHTTSKKGRWGTSFNPSTLESSSFSQDTSSPIWDGNHLIHGWLRMWAFVWILSARNW